MIPRVVPVDVGGAADGTATCRVPDRWGNAADALCGDEPVTDEVGVVTDMIAATEVWGNEPVLNMQSPHLLQGRMGAFRVDRDNGVLLAADRYGSRS